MVVSILSVLTSVVLVTVDNTREKAKLSAIKTNTKTIFNEGAIYHSDNNGFSVTSNYGTCDSMGGMFGTTKISESLNRISDMSDVNLGSSDFYCYVEPNNWSFALDISSITRDDEIFCASSFDGRIFILEDSNDVNVEDYIINNRCESPST